MPFPVTKRYFLDFRNSDTGLTPTFTFFQITPGFTATTPSSPAGGIVEKSNGRYYFDWIWLTKTDSDIVFQVDGGASIPTEEVRYIKGTISPKDAFLDEPISQVVDDVWTDVTNRAVGTKGDFVEHIGIDTDAVDAATVFGKVYKARDAIMGGTGFGGTGVDVKTTYDRVGAPLGGFTTIADQLGDPSGANSIAQDIAAVKGVVDTINTETDPAAIADAVWDASTTGNVGGGTMGGLVDTINTAVGQINTETDPASIANAVWDAATAGNIGVGTMGGLVNDAASGSSSAAAVATAVWDKSLASHTTPGTFGQTLQLEDSGLAQGGAATTVTLKAGASAINDFYKNGLITITSGTGVGQSRSITAYDGATKIATVDRNWGTNPISGDGYIVLPAAPSSSLTNAGIAGAVWDEALASHTLQGSFGQTMQLLHYGTAVAGAANTVTLAVGASGTNSFYNNALLVITAGTGVGQARTITAYVGGTRVATVDRIWSIQPTGTSQYMIVPAAQAPLDTATIADAVWDEPLAGHLTVGSTGEKLDSGSGGGGGVSFLSNGDTVNPIIVQVSSPKFTQVKITFSEPVVMTNAANGALNLANYSIPGLTLVGVVSLTAQQVLLTTSAQTPNFLYSLAITNVEDLVGNPIL